jgi:hypothetical protein
MVVLKEEDMRVVRAAAIAAAALTPSSRTTKTKPKRETQGRCAADALRVDTDSGYPVPKPQVQVTSVSSRPGLINSGDTSEEGQWISGKIKAPRIPPV